MRVVKETDVVVVGGGTAGFIAAVASARNGAKTLLVEQSGVLGGTPVAGLMTIYITFHDVNGNHILKGIADELIRRIKENGGSLGYVYETQGNMNMAAPIDAEVAKYTMIEMAEEAEIDILFDTTCTDALVLNNCIKGVVVSNKTGNSLVLAKRVIDCTGDGDVSVFAGAEYEMRPSEFRQPITLMFRMGDVDVGKWIDYMKNNHLMFNLVDGIDSLDKPWVQNILKNFPPWQEAIKNGELGEGFALEQAWYHTHGADISKSEVTFNMTRITGYDPTDIWDLSKVHAILQKQIPIAEKFICNNMPGFEKSYVIDSASILGVRESRRIIGETVLTKEHVVNGIIDDETVGLSCCPIDIHEGHGEGKFVWLKTDDRGSKAYGIPYGCLLPKSVDNLLVAGRCISTTWEANGSARMQGTCLVTGQAAGVAAALSIKNKVSPRELSIKDLRDNELSQGVVLEI